MRDLTLEQLLAELRALRPEFERRGIVRMSMFGSRARGDHSVESDVDLIVDIDPDRLFTGINLAGIYGIIEDSIGLESSLVTSRGLRDAPAFGARIEPDRIVVF